MRFGNSQSPDKFTEKPKRAPITKKPLTGIRIRRQELGEDGMKVEVTEKRGIGGIIILTIYDPRPLGVRPIPFRTLLACASMIPIPTRARQFQQ